jgi:hypothetical protein
MTPAELKKALTELRRHWRAWLVLMEPFFSESNRRCRAFGIGVALGEKGRESALAADAPGNTDTAGEAQAFAMGVAAGPVLRSYLLKLVIDAIAGVRMEVWLRAILVAIAEALIGKAR